jgi:hypothetical protein
MSSKELEDEEAEEPDDEYVDSAMSQKIFQTAHLQQKQMRAELGEEGAEAKVKFQSVDNDDDSDVEEVGCHPLPPPPFSRFAFPTHIFAIANGLALVQDLIAAEQDELEEIDITEAEERDLQLFMPAQKSARRTLADIIMEKIAQKQTDGGGPAMPLEDMQQEQIASMFPYPPKPDPTHPHPSCVCSCACGLRFAGATACRNVHAGRHVPKPLHKR